MHKESTDHLPVNMHVTQPSQVMSPGCHRLSFSYVWCLFNACFPLISSILSWWWSKFKHFMSRGGNYPLSTKVLTHTTLVMSHVFWIWSLTYLQTKARKHIPENLEKFAFHHSLCEYACTWIFCVCVWGGELYTSGTTWTWWNFMFLFSILKHGV